MEHAEIVRQRLALYEAASARSAHDAAFRARLIAGPRTTLDALAKELGYEARVPDGVEIAVLDWSAATVHLILPPPLDPPLSEALLDGVVGGMGMMGTAAARSEGDAHGCPLCPHPATFSGSLTRR
jgi:hypothetical protein